MTTPDSWTISITGALRAHFKQPDGSSRAGADWAVLLSNGVEVKRVLIRTYVDDVGTAAPQEEARLVLDYATRLLHSGWSPSQYRGIPGELVAATRQPAPYKEGPMSNERRRQLKAAGKAEVEQRSANLRAAMTASNPAQVGSDEWAQRYQAGVQRERWIRAKLPVLHRATVDATFVVLQDGGAGWVPHVGGYLRCRKCGSVAPSALPRRLFYWASCACGNIRWRCVLFWRRGVIADPEAVEPVKLIGRG